MVGAQHAASFLAARIEAAIDLLACVLFNGSEGDELVHKTTVRGFAGAQVRTTHGEPANPEP